MPQSVPNLDVIYKSKEYVEDKDAYDVNADKLARQFYENLKSLLPLMPEKHWKISFKYLLFICIYFN